MRSLIILKMKAMLRLPCTGKGVCIREICPLFGLKGRLVEKCSATKKWVDDALELFSDDRTLLPVNGLAINSAINQLYDNGKGPATATVILGGVCSGSLQCL